MKHLFEKWRGYLKETPQFLYHATFRPYLKSILATGLGGPGKTNWEDSVSGVVYLATSPEVAESYAETSEMVPEEYLDEIVIIRVDTRLLDEEKISLDKNVLDNAGDTLEYEGIIPLDAMEILNK